MELVTSSRKIDILRTNYKIRTSLNDFRGRSAFPDVAHFLVFTGTCMRLHRKGKELLKNISFPFPTKLSDNRNVGTFPPPARTRHLMRLPPSASDSEE